MKRYFLFLLLVFLCFLCACHGQRDMEIEQPFHLFYQSSEVFYGTGNGVIQAETVSLDAAQMSLDDLVRRYMEGPTSNHLLAALPSSWQLCEAYLDGFTAVVVFDSSDDGQISSIERSLAEACLARTLLQLDEVQRVSIALNDELPVTLMEKDLLLTDTGMEAPQEEIVLYLPQENRRYLMRETQTVAAMDALDKPAYILRQLLKTPPGESAIPPGTVLLGVSVENGVSTVNLSSQFLFGMEQSFSAERMAVYSIVNSITELPQIETVDLWVSGAPLERLQFMELSNGIVRDETMIATPESRDIPDVTLYPACKEKSLLAAVPQRIEMVPETQIAQTLLDALIAYEGENGINGCIPQGTKVLSLKIENSVCVVDFTGEFLEGCADAEAERLAVRSVVATLVELEQISAVEILVEGLEPDYRDEALRQVRTPRNEWFAQ